MSSSPFSIGTRVLGGGAAILILFLVVGFLLPGTWSARASVQIDAPPEAVFPWLDSPRAWTRWTPWPDTGLVMGGPAHGVGSVITWDNAGLARRSQRRGVTPFVLLLNRSGNKSARSLTVMVRSSLE